MKLIVGLGNPGEKYKLNRHNVGFLLLDYLVEQIKNEELRIKNKLFTNDKYLEAEICEIEIKGKKVLLAKPQTFMNDSGKAVSKIIKNHELRIKNDLFVVHDDLDIKLGEYKIQIGKGPKLHNGIESIENHLHTKEFTRVRIGVDNRDLSNRVPGEKYVLQDFNKHEMTILEEVFKSIAQEFLI